MGMELELAEDPEGGTESLKTAMKTIIKASPFDRAMKVEAELNKLNGRIIKLLDSMRAHEADLQYDRPGQGGQKTKSHLRQSIRSHER